MNANLTEIWFNWFYKKWEENEPGNLLENGLKTSQISERFINENQDELVNIANKFDQTNYDALIEFMKLCESELLILKYFLKLIKSQGFKDNF